MRILLTNDDGIHAPGLLALERELRDDFEIHIVAPETEMSAVGHAITLNSPLKVQDVYKNGTFYGYAVTGTPADCVKIALQELVEGPVDMVISGINLGSNVGVNVLYSGTVSAATEGAFLGIRSVAISLNTRFSPDFRFAARFSRWVIDYIDRNGLSRGIALNVNVPALPPSQIKGMAITRQGLSRYRERFERRINPRGNVYYWLTGEILLEEGIPDADENVLKKDCITITPIHYDLTSLPEMERLRGCPLPDFKEPGPDGNGAGDGFAGP